MAHEVVKCPQCDGYGIVEVVTKRTCFGRGATHESIERPCLGCGAFGYIDEHMLATIAIDPVAAWELSAERHKDDTSMVDRFKLQHARELYIRMQMNTVNAQLARITKR